LSSILLKQNKMRLLFIVFLLLTAFWSFGQLPDTLTLYECYEQSVINYPVVKQKEFIKDSYANKIRNINTNWYPSLLLNGQATYQSDVVDIPVQGLELPSQPHDQYKLYLELNQQIYDGGSNKSYRNIENTNFEIGLKQIDVELSSLKRRITGVYFSILLLGKQKDLLDLTLEELYEKSVVVESGVENGVLLPADKNVLEAEILKLKQKVLDTELGKETLLKVLGELTGIQLDTGIYLVLPESDLAYESVSIRPELELFDLHKKHADLNTRLLSTVNRPKFFAFSQAGYGKPGLNMLNEEFDTYYLIGLGFRWSFFDWGDNKRKAKILYSQKEIIDTKIETFEKNLNISLENEIANITKYKRSVELDKQIVELRTQVKESSFSQLENGVITSTDFLTELNAETQAKLQLETHIILLQQSVFNYLTLKGEI
jgi:outer membrane protein TolC